MAWTWLIKLLGLSFAGVCTSVAPSCTWDGRYFNSALNILDITSTCAVQFGTSSGFSTAFTLEVSSFSNQGIIDFGTSFGVGGVRVTASSAGHLQWSVYDDGGAAFHVSSGSVTVNVAHRWLMTIDSSGHMEIYKDGVKDGEGNSGKSMTTVSRTLMVGGLLDGSSIFQEGRNEDVFLFNQVVDWASAAVPAPSAVCTWEGRLFDGSENQIAYPTGCPSWAGGSLSVALTVRMDAWGADNTVAFDFVGSVNKEKAIFLTAIKAELLLAFETWNLARGAGGLQIGKTSKPYTTGVTNRILVVAASNGYQQMFVDGELLAEGYSPPAVPSDSQTFTIGGPKNAAGYRWIGLVEDFYVFHDKVGWDSAVVPAGTPDCTYAGGEFHGASNVDLATICTPTFGGSLSFAFRARVDATVDQIILGFMPVDGSQIPIPGERIILAYVYADGRIACWHGEFGVGTSTSVVGLTQRYLCTFSSTGIMQMFVDGTLVQEANGVAISSATRAMKLASNHDSSLYFDGLVEDLYIFHSKVGWNSATTSSTTTTSLTLTSTSTATTSTASSITSTTSTLSTTSTTTTSSATTTSTSITVTRTSSTLTSISTTTSSTTSSTATTTSSSSTKTSTSSTSGSTMTSSTSATSTKTSTSSTSGSSTTSSTSATATTTSSSTATTSTLSTRSSTTTSSTTTRSEDGVIEFAEEVNAAFSSLAVRLAGSNQTVITESLRGGLLQMTKLESLYPPGSSEPSPSPEPERVALDIPEVDVTISIPLSFLDLQPPNVSRADVLVGVVIIDPNTSESGLRYWASKAHPDGTPMQVEAVMALEFLQLDGTPLNVNRLPEPIEYTMQANYTYSETERSECAFWDERLQQWSNQGVRESPQNQVGETLVCLTDHLSLFGALFRGLLQGFVTAIICSQLILLNPEGIKNMVQGDWYMQAGAVFYWWTLAASFVLCVIGVVLDKWRARRGHTWSSEFFLHAVEQETTLRKEESDEDASQGSAEVPKQGFIPWAVCCCLGGMATACSWFKETAAGDAVDEILSEWFGHFSEVRECIEGCWGGLEVGALGAGRIFQLSHSAMCQVTLSSARRQAGASLYLSDDVVNFVLDHEDLQDVLMTKCVPTSTSSNLSGGVPEPVSTEPRARWWACPNYQEAWFLLHAEVIHSVCRHINHHRNIRNLPWIILRIFFTHNPIGLVFCHDIFFNCKLRSFFYALEIHGSFMVAAVFFAGSGGRRGRIGAEEPDECGEDGPKNVFFIVGRATVVAFGAVLLSGLPITFLQSLHTRTLKSFEAVRNSSWLRQLRAWWFQDVFIWVFGSLYLCFCTFFVCLFLANISNKDHEEFARTATMCIIHNTIVMPLVVALFVPTIAGILLAVNGAASGGRESLFRDIHCRLYAKTNVMLPLVTV